MTENAQICGCQHLAITASDSLNSILELQFFLEIASEGIYDTAKCDLLLRSYLDQATPHFRNLKQSLKALRREHE